MNCRHDRRRDCRHDRRPDCRRNRRHDCRPDRRRVSRHNRRHDRRRLVDEHDELSSDQLLDGRRRRRPTLAAVTTRLTILGPVRDAYHARRRRITCNKHKQVSKVMWQTDASPAYTVRLQKTKISRQAYTPDSVFYLCSFMLTFECIVSVLYARLCTVTTIDDCCLSRLPLPRRKVESNGLMSVCPSVCLPVLSSILTLMRSWCVSSALKRPASKFNILSPTSFRKIAYKPQRRPHKHTLRPRALWPDFQNFLRFS